MKANWYMVKEDLSISLKLAGYHLHHDGQEPDCRGMLEIIHLLFFDYGHAIGKI